MKKISICLFILLSLGACSSETQPEESAQITEPVTEQKMPQDNQQDADQNNGDNSSDDPNTEPNENDTGSDQRDDELPELNAQDHNMFIMGHSLIVHAWGDLASDETTVPHWMVQFSQATNADYSASGQYGFLMQHAQNSPYPQWAFGHSYWDADTGQSFAEQNFDSLLLTAANFVQYKAPELPYDGDNPQGVTPLSATTDIIDFVSEQEPGITIYIYENWPDMASFTPEQNFSPTNAELTAYYDYTLDDTEGGFHYWWLDYHDRVMELRPNANVKMIPVGPIMFELLTETALSGIPALSLYEDNAPHGRPTLYFLAAMITYNAIHGAPVPEHFSVPAGVHDLIADNFDELRTIIHNKLVAFTDDMGNSRVW